MSVGVTHSCRPGPLWEKASLKTNRAGDFYREDVLRNCSRIWLFWRFHFQQHKESIAEPGVLTTGEEDTDVPAPQPQAEPRPWLTKESSGCPAKLEFQVNNHFFY